MQQALQQQQYQSGVLAAAAAAAMTQMEPVSNGNLPPGYVGNVHPNVTENLLIEVFQGSGPVERCKLIRKEKSSFGFVDYYDRRSAALAIMTLHGRHIYGQAIKVNWAFASTQREDTSGHFHIFVGDLSSEVNDATLYACFSTYPSCYVSFYDARVMWDNKTGRSRGYGFVSFRNQQEAETAITEMTGKWLGSRQIRCNWATKTSMKRNKIKCSTGKGFGFIRYSTHGEAALAIQMANGLVVRGKPIKCSWGNKPTPPGTSSKPLPPPIASYQPVAMAGVPQGFTAAELLAYQRQLALSQAAAGQIAGQHGLAGQVSAGLLAAGSQALYDGYPNQTSAQQLMPATSSRLSPSGRSSCSAPPRRAWPPRRPPPPAYARASRYDEVLLAARELSARDPAAARDLYPLAVSCLGAAGELALMEDAVQEMARAGLRVDSATGNAFVRHYAVFGTVPEMEAAVGRLKKSGLLISVDAIRAVASSYIAHRKYYKLGEFVRGVGLGRRNAGNMLWNLYLLSFAANFKMKSLQRAFLEMTAAGYRPDLTTFNIRAAAFSKMCMFWDLHLTAEHMRRDGVAPDLVTHGCFVDAYMERRLARNISFAFRRLDGAGEPVVATDGVVFEAFGKGGFHATSEALLEAAGGKRRWTYYDLLGVYLRKQHRKNQIFWNY
ncbi:hypothetical protein ZWY2020_011203 [Hordeum vulgare]|nr:hypothetical protein ZWY2020_011203 [Hordeum vulgare]